VRYPASRCAAISAAAAEFRDAVRAPLARALAAPPRAPAAPGALTARARGSPQLAAFRGDSSAGVEAPHPPRPRAPSTKQTRLVLPPVLSGHISSFPPY
jgi:hypothetical protein